MTDAESSNAPPTMPGVLGKGGGLPTSRPAIWSLSCGALGLIVTPFALAGIVVGIIAIRRLTKQKGKRQGYGIAIAGIATGAIGLVFGTFYIFMVWSVLQAVTQARSSADAIRLSKLRVDALVYADDRQRYPAHIALLSADPELGGLDAHLMVVDRFDRNQRNVVTVGGYDFCDYDGSLKADHAVIAAVESLDDTSPTYRFGDVKFVRLVGPTNDPGIIFCWRTNPDTGVFTVVLDDGSTGLGFTAEDWASFRETDAEARKSNGLAAIELPPKP